MTDILRSKTIVWLGKLVTLTALVALSGPACSGDDAAKKNDSVARSGGGEGGRARLNNLEIDAYTVETVDLNEDKKPDQWTFKDSSSVKRYERDMNFDGRVDVWQYPNAAGDIVEEEMDLDLDGNVDVVVFYEEGIVSQKLMSLDFTGEFTVNKFYDKEGNLLRVERDEDVDGTTDVFEYYENSQMVRIGWDEDGDGSPDKFDNL